MQLDYLILTFIVTQNIISALSVTIVAGACGLAVGTPIALLATNSKLAKKGIIVKGGKQIENLKNTGTIVFDKTGTLTIGKPTVSQVISFDHNIEPKYVLEYAALAEKNINHHFAKAIEERAKEEKIQLNLNSNQYTISDKKNSNLVKVGRGVTLTTQNGHRISVGNTKFMEEQLLVTNEDKKSSHLNPKFSLVSNLQCYRYLLDGHNQNPNNSAIGIQQITQSEISSIVSSIIKAVTLVRFKYYSFGLNTCTCTQFHIAT